ncbi:MAG: hypothetical protein MRK02_05300 [Candidatus Scalindua sp.]|nr:hypothetical protein [Candidatus Scalindua sp.]
MKTKNTIIIILIPFLFFACSSLKHPDKLSDKDLIDKYYETDLKLYMVKRSSGKGYETGLRTSNGNVENTEHNRESLEKVGKLEKRLEIMRQELLKRGYMP